VKICVTLFILNFFFDVFLMETNHTFLELLEVSYVMKAFENIILKLLLIAFLLLKLLSQIGNFISETFLSHSQIIND